MDELEQSGTDVIESPSPSADEASKSESSAPAEQPKQSEPPFGEHPRFKELIQQKNELSTRLQDMERSFKELQGKVDQSNKPVAAASKEAALISRLKGIDPEFGTWAEQQEALKAQLAEFTQWRQQSEARTTQEAVASGLEKLHSEYKVPEGAKNIYQAMIREQATLNPQLGLKDLPTVYKQVHETVSKLLEAQKRDALASYSKEKAVDSKMPPASKVQAAPSKPGASKQAAAKYSSDPTEARAQVVSNALKLFRNQS